MKQSNCCVIWTRLFLFLIILVTSSLSQTLYGVGSTFPDHFIRNGLRAIGNFILPSKFTTGLSVLALELKI
jgi:hypothetical protein